MAAPIEKYDGDPIGATVQFNYKGPASYYNVGVIVETKPNVIFMMREHYCSAMYDSWAGQSVSVDGVWAASFLDHGDLVTCLMVIYPSGQSPVPNGDGSLIKQGSGETYVHRVTPQPVCTEGETKCIGADLYACVSGSWQLEEANSVSCPVDDDGDESIMDWLTKYWYIVVIGIVALVIGAYMFTKK